MPPSTLELRCACGKLLRIPGHLAGKTGRCPSCAHTLQIPRPPSSEGIRLRPREPEPVVVVPPPVLTRQCFLCEQGYPDEVVICTACGVDLIEQRQLPIGDAVEGEEARREAAGFWRGLLPAFTYLFRPVSLTVLVLCSVLLFLTRLALVVGSLLAAVFYLALVFEQVKQAATGDLRERGLRFPDIDNAFDWLLSFLKVVFACAVTMVPLWFYLRWIAGQQATLGAALVQVHLILPLLLYGLYLPMAILVMALFDSPFGALHPGLLGRLITRAPGHYLATVLLFWALPIAGSLLRWGLATQLPYVALFVGPVLELASVCMAAAVLGCFYRYHKTALEF